MSDLKISCPACDAWTSAVGAAFRDGDPCPSCGLPAATAKSIDDARERKIAQDVLDALAKAEVRACEAEEQVRNLKARIEDARRALAVEGDS